MTINNGENKMDQRIVIKGIINQMSLEASKLRRRERKVLENARVASDHLFDVKLRKLNDARKEFLKKAQEETDVNYNIYQNLRHRRTHELRKRAREVFLAYAFFRGDDYSKIETKTHNLHNDIWENVEKIIFSWINSKEHDPRDVKQRYEEWVQGAANYLNTTTNA
jgi:hypothetical protein